MVPVTLWLALLVGPADGAGFTRDNADFAFALHAKLPAKGNLFYSPYSISSAFGMVYAGAAGETAAELAGALRFAGDPADLHRAFQETNEDLNAWGKSGAVKLTVANALWGEQSRSFLKEFVEVCDKRYGGALRRFDLRGGAAKVRDLINAWVERNTGGRIAGIIPEGGINSDTKLVLTNAIYFKGDWLHLFDKARTAPAPFFKAGGGKATASLMAKVDSFRYGEFDGFQALELPYRGEKLAMLVLLPKTPGGLPALEKRLSGLALQRWGESLREGEVEVYLPKFKLEGNYQLNALLASLGARRAFDASKADFSKMTGGRDLYITSAVHKAFVAVDEEGTEAAAATVVMMGPTAAAVRKAPPVFRADRPFVFLIRDIRGNVLFVGRLSDPG